MNGHVHAQSSLGTTAANAGNGKVVCKAHLAAYRDPVRCNRGKISATLSHHWLVSETLFVLPAKPCQILHGNDEPVWIAVPSLTSHKIPGYITQGVLALQVPGTSMLLVEQSYGRMVNGTAVATTSVHRDECWHAHRKNSTLLQLKLRERGSLLSVRLQACHRDASENAVILGMCFQ